MGASKAVEGPELRYSHASVVKDAVNAERPTSAPSDRSPEVQSKKLAHKYRFNRLSVRKRAKFLLRKHHQRKSKEHREQKEAAAEASASSSAKANSFTLARQLKNETKRQPAAAAAASASPRKKTSKSKRC